MGMSNADVKNNYDRYTRAYNLFVIDGHALETIAQSESIPISTLKNWSRKDDWVADREAAKKSEKELTQNIQDGLRALGAKAKAGNIQALQTIMKARREMRHQQDPRELIVDFATSLVTILENMGEKEAAVLVAENLEQAAKKVVG